MGHRAVSGGIGRSLKRVTVVRALRMGLLGVLAALFATLGLSLAVDATYTPVCASRPAAGTVIAAPGERMEIVSPARARDDVLALDVVRDPFPIVDYALPAEHGHIHPLQEERFEVVSGRARFLIGEEYVELGPGDVGVVPPDTVHHWMALDDQPVRVTAFFAPALDVDQWFLNFERELQAGNMDLLQAAVISREFEGAPLPVSPPPAVMNLLVRVLAPIGRALGYRACPAGDAASR